MLPPSRREFKDIYAVFEFMESDLHQVIKANDDLTPEHHQIFLYQLLRTLKYIHTENVFHRDLKPKNILANADCKLKICDFGLARVSFNDAPSAIFWTDYVATRWYRASELCGSFFSKIRNEKARRYLSSMRRKQPIPFSQKYPNADPLTLRFLERLLAFDPKDRPTAEEALADPYFKGLAKVEHEPSTQPISKLEFEFERRRLTKDDVRELIYREILEYHPQMLKEYLCGGNNANFMYPSAVDMFKRQFAHLEEHYGKGERSTPLDRQHASLPRERVIEFREDTTKQDSEKQQGTAAVTKSSLQSPPRVQGMTAQPSKVIGSGVSLVNGASKAITNPRSLVKSSSISASQCSPAVNAYQKRNSIMRPEDENREDSTSELDVSRLKTDSVVAGLATKVAAMSSGVARS